MRSKAAERIASDQGSEVEIYISGNEFSSSINLNYFLAINFPSFQVIVLSFYWLLDIGYVTIGGARDSNSRTATNSGGWQTKGDEKSISKILQHAKTQRIFLVPVYLRPNLKVF